MRVLLWAALAGVVVAIVAGSLMTGLTQWPRDLSPGLTHLSAYTLLGGLMALALTAYRGGTWLALVGTVLIGAAVELLQMTVPVRAFSLFDLGMNAAGAVTGVGLVSASRWVLRRQGSAS